MKNIFKTISVVGCLAFSVTVFAAKPMSITFVADGKTPDGQDFSSYTVKCSDAKEEFLTAWDQRKNWCVGKDSKENCDKKQIRAAKVACKDTSSD
jgi:hypothetical protein